MFKYSFLNLIRQSFKKHKDWPQAWRKPDPKKSYDVIIIGAGGHGLATAYYLAKEHNIHNIAVLERSWLGSGNTARNTTIIRSNYLLNESSDLYEFSLKLWKKLGSELNYNIMFSPRGLLTLAHSEHDLYQLKRRVYALNLKNIDSDILDIDQIKKLCPILNFSPYLRYPILGASFQKRAGIARHDAVAWGFARACSNYGIDIIENCEVKGLKIINNQINGVETTRGFIETKKVGCVVAGHTSILAEMAGLKLPISSIALQAMVSEPVKPILDPIVMSNAIHVYVSQSAKGELVLGAGVDGYNSYGQRGSAHITEKTINALTELFPTFGRLKMMRQWAGIVDVCPDASPIIGQTPIKGFYINGGWGTGGFKATPGSGWIFAYTIAQDQPHKLNEAFSLERFRSGYLIDEHGAAGVAH
ncbi:MAG: sarcosine oxidase subunit beta family protein [Alphaproteobacteria bacterium]|nr:sarcosine oxidase subunit beta family protein [Alphaproteobacteria bacterium]